jgi:DNA repair exonuclease SbcCD ATPase subunit
VARRTTAANKKTPPKVLTNDDLEKSRQGGAAVSVLAADGVAATSERNAVTSSELEPQDVVAKDEATWRPRADAARMRIAEADANLTQAEQRLAELRSDLTADDTMNPYREQNRAAEISTQMERVDASRAEAAAARQAMSDLEDEARRASIPPGWLRER